MTDERTSSPRRPVFEPKAQRQITALTRRDKAAAHRAWEMIDTIAQTTRPPGSAVCAGKRHQGVYRLASGKLRVLYVPGRADEPATIRAVGYRRDVYGRGASVSN